MTHNKSSGTDTNRYTDITILAMMMMMVVMMQVIYCRLTGCCWKETTSKWTRARSLAKVIWSRRRQLPTLFCCPVAHLIVVVTIPCENV